ncbi:hypothetical protein M440DRAFT_1397584, partial [Trichoderma longibrachiatum ATCC 18648]
MAFLILHLVRACSSHLLLLWHVGSSEMVYVMNPWRALKHRHIAWVECCRIHLIRAPDLLSYIQSPVSNLPFVIG